MRLHRTISPDLPLLVVALEEEATHLHVSSLPVLVTGPGKVNAAVAVSMALADTSPSLVVNLGTAGALHDGLTGIHTVSTVMQHDFDDRAVHGLTGLHFGAAIDLADEGVRLLTGDAFIADVATRSRLAQRGDLVDMEGYAVAHAAVLAGVPVTLVKMVSDPAGAEAARTWRQTVDDCAEALGAWAREELLG